MKKKEECQMKWEKLKNGKNPLMAYRAEQLLKYSNMEITKFDAEQMHCIMESISIFESGRIKIRYFDEIEVKCNIMKLDADWKKFWSVFLWRYDIMIKIW